MGYKDEEIMDDYYLAMLVNDVSPEEQALDSYVGWDHIEPEDDEDVADLGYNVDGC